MRISDWSSDVCSSDLLRWPSKPFVHVGAGPGAPGAAAAVAAKPGAPKPESPVPSNPAPASLSMSRRSVTSLSRSEEHTSELQSLMRISYAVFCLKKKNTKNNKRHVKIQTHPDN